MNHRRHFVLIIVPALILVASPALHHGHFFYSVSNQPHSVQTGLAVIFDHFLPIPDDRDPVIETRFCLNSDHYYSAFLLRNFGNLSGDTQRGGGCYVFRSGTNYHWVVPGAMSQIVVVTNRSSDQPPKTHAQWQTRKSIH